MSFDNVFESSLIDDSQTFRIQDTKEAINQNLFCFFNYANGYAESSRLEDNLPLMHLLNFFMTTVISKELGCRMQPRLPYPFDKEAEKLTFLQLLQKYAENIKIVFAKLPEEFVPDIEKWSIEEVNPERKIGEDGIIIDILGAYHPRKGFSNDPEKRDEPFISIDIIKIKDEYSESADKIATIIFIHELCHALLDPNNYFKYAGREIDNVKDYHFIDPQVKYNTLYGCCKEEAVANYMAYRIIKELNNKDLLKEADSFMSSQKGAYLYGYLLAKKGAVINPEDWIMEKINGAVAAKDWLKSMWLVLKVNNAPFTNPNRNEFLDFQFITRDEIGKIAEQIVSRGFPSEQMEDLCKPGKMTIGGLYGKIKICGKTIELTSMQAAFYMLLLRHSEGICNDMVEDFADEMELCYNNISPYAPNSKGKDFQGITKNKASELVSRINDTIETAFSDLPFIMHYYVINKDEGRNGRWWIEYTNTDFYSKLQEQLANYFKP